MDKVIIDGVDVSECKNFIPVYTEDTDIEINNCCTLTYTPCQFEKKDCYYKQLKRAKAEIFELKESLKVFQRPDITKILTLYKVGDIELLEQKCDRLQAENDNLKDDIDKQQLYVDSLEQENEQIKKDYAKLHIDFAKCNEENERLKEEKQELSIEIVSLTSELFTLEKSSNDLSQCTNKLHQALQEIKQKLDRVMTEEFTISEEWKPFELIDECRNKINEVIGAE